MNAHDWPIVTKLRISAEGDDWDRAVITVKGWRDDQILMRNPSDPTDSVGLYLHCEFFTEVSALEQLARSADE